MVNVPQSALANSKGEYYLVDAVTIVREMGLEAVVIETGEDEVRGINTKAQLAEAEAVMQARLRAGMETLATLDPVDVGASERDSGKSTEPPNPHRFAPGPEHHIKRERGS